jgi:hypothetical protein
MARIPQPFAKGDLRRGCDFPYGVSAIEKKRQSEKKK